MKQKKSLKEKIYLVNKLIKKNQGKKKKLLCLKLNCVDEKRQKKNKTKPSTETKSSEIRNFRVRPKYAKYSCYREGIKDLPELSSFGVVVLRGDRLLQLGLGRDRHHR